ncbi:MAG TPA: hypothetical protein VIF62_37780 [Labilithrix sp.]
MRAMLVLAIGGLTSVLVVEACTGFDAVPPVDDGGAADAPADAIVPENPEPPDSGSDGAPPPPCNTSAPFAGPVPIAGLATLDSVARFSSDEKTTYYAITNDGGSDELYRATLDPITGAFGTASPLTEVNDDAGETTPWVTTDGLSLFYVHGGGTMRDIWYATRADGGDFASPQIVGGVNDPTSQDDYVSVATNLDLWFSSRRAGGQIAIVRALYTGAGYGIAQAVDELNSATDGNYYPLLTSDMLRIYFARLGPSTADFDIWTATRTVTTDPFSKVVPVTELNTTDADRPVWISSDSCRLYVSRGMNHMMLVASKPAW